MSNISSKPLVTSSPGKRIASYVGEGSKVFAKYVGKIQIEPRQQPRMSLGVFGPEVPAKGFSVEFTPELADHESVATRITSKGNARSYELFLQIANHSSRPITAEVWQL